MKMEETSTEIIHQVLTRQKAFFASGQTRSLDFRRTQLIKLKTAIRQNEKQIQAALWQDLHKSPEETWLTEISLVQIPQLNQLIGFSEDISHFYRVKMAYIGAHHGAKLNPVRIRAAAKRP